MLDLKARTEIADTIRQQIGAPTLAEIGARDFVVASRGLDLRTGSRGTVRVISVQLNALDLYDVRLVSYSRGFKPQADRTVHNVGCEQLPEVVRDLAKGA